MILCLLTISILRLNLKIYQNTDNRATRTHRRTHSPRVVVRNNIPEAQHGLQLYAVTRARSERS